MIVGALGRLVLTSLLLWCVWQQVSWAPALAITLTALAVEVMAMLVMWLRKRIERLEAIEDRRDR